VYFTEDKFEARRFGKNIKEAKLDIKNPKEMTRYEFFSAIKNSTPKKFKDDLLSKGFDGLRLTGMGTVGENKINWVAFSNEQIKTKQQLLEIYNKANKK
jgi:hypothetical protein